MTVFQKGDQIRVAETPAQETKLRFDGFHPVKDESGEVKPTEAELAERSAEKAKQAELAAEADKANSVNPADVATKAQASNKPKPAAPKTN